jgi:hypothetical protein
MTSDQGHIRDRAPAPTLNKRAEIEAFFQKVRDPVSRNATVGARGRLIFALDATESRQPTWDIACELQAEMFQEVASIGGLDVQLAYYRGARECRASGWVSDGQALANLMAKIKCRSGYTQLGRVFAHALAENEGRRVQGVVFVGDAMEEDPAEVVAVASKLGLPVFVFQEGDDPVATRTFREIARVTKGAHCRFDPGAARELGQLLRAVAAYAAGGLKALDDLSARRNAGAVKLLQQLR